MRVFAGLLALVFTISAGAASASSINGVHITEIVPNNAGIVRIYIDQSRTGLPSCASGTPTALSINVTTTAGQALVSALYLAFSSNLLVDISGTGVCDIETGVESLGYAGIRHS
jgi:hypothetical protein